MKQIQLHEIPDSTEHPIELPNEPPTNPPIQWIIKPPTKPPTEPPTEHFTCLTGEQECIPILFKCDGVVADCADGSDESFNLCGKLLLFLKTNHFFNVLTVYY
jgi:hypothetical protein